MKCVKCSKELNLIRDKHYEIDVYRFGFGININYLNEIILCEECFNNIEWLKGDKSHENKM